MNPYTITAIVGTGLQMYGQYTAAQEKASLLRQQAAFDEIKATEILQRVEINNEVVRTRSGQSMSEVQARAAGSGVDVGSQAVLAGLEEVARLASQEISQQTRDAQFEASMVRLGIGSQNSAANNVENAGTLATVGAGINGISNYFMNKPGGYTGTVSANKSSNSSSAPSKSLLGSTSTYWGSDPYGAK